MTPPSSSTPARTSAWHRAVSRVAAAAAFSRLRLVGAERIPRDGAILFVGLHRNGAVDGFVYGPLVGDPVFLISTQLRRSRFARLFFSGIAVARKGDDDDRGENAAALDDCRRHLAAGGRLFVFPEGTSSLGPRHLPFKSGAAHLVLDHLATPGAAPLAVVPLGIHYEAATSFRSAVEVLVGAPVALDFADGMTPMARLRELQRRITASLVAVGLNVESDAEQERIEDEARLASLGRGTSYAVALKALERIGPSATAAERASVAAATKTTPLPLRYHRLPLASGGSLPGRLAIAVGAVVAWALVLPGLLLNLPPLAGGAIAGRRFADDRNVVTLWRLLVGLPMFVAWGAALVAVAVASGRPLAAVGWLVATLLTFRLYDPAKRLAVETPNNFLHPALAGPFEAWRDAVQRAVDSCPADR